MFFAPRVCKKVKTPSIGQFLGAHQNVTKRCVVRWLQAAICKEYHTMPCACRAHEQHQHSHYQHMALPVCEALQSNNIYIYIVFIICIYLCIYIYIYIYSFIYHYLSIYLSVSLFVHLFIYLIIYIIHHGHSAVYNNVCIKFIL